MHIEAGWPASAEEGEAHQRYGGAVRCSISRGQEREAIGTMTVHLSDSQDAAEAGIAASWQG